MATILVVDDHETIREIIIDFLGETGHTMIQAINGKQAQQKIKKAKPPIDLVITDFRMPEMNGIELILWIKKEHPEIPVILMSSDDLDKVSPADIFVKKPDGFNDFAAVCNQLLKKNKKA